MHASLNSRKIANLRSHRACGRLATAVGMLGHVTMSDPGQTTDVMWFPDVPRRFSQQNFPRRLYAGLQSLEHLPHAPFNIFQYVQRQRSQKSHSLNFGTQFLQLQQCQLRNDAKLIQVAPIYSIGHQRTHHSFGYCMVRPPKSARGSRGLFRCFRRLKVGNWLRYSLNRNPHGFHWSRTQGLKRWYTLVYIGTL